MWTHNQMKIATPSRVHGATSSFTLKNFCNSKCYNILCKKTIFYRVSESAITFCRWIEIFKSKSYYSLDKIVIPFLKSAWFYLLELGLIGWMSSSILKIQACFERYPISLENGKSLENSSMAQSEENPPLIYAPNWFSAGQAFHFPSPVDWKC